MWDYMAPVPENPDRPHFIMGTSGEVVTRLQLRERANRGAQFFRSLGLKGGDCIALVMENNRHFLEIVSAASRSGLIYTPISTHLTPAEVEYIVNDCGAKVFLTSAAKQGVAAELVNRMPNVIARMMVGGAIQGYEPWEERTAQYPAAPIADEVIGEAMLYSSGTTGRPKGTRVAAYRNVSYAELLAQLKPLMALFNINEETVFLSSGPLFHVFSLRLSLLTLLAGGTVVVMERFDAKQALALIEKHRVTHSQWVPTMFIRMLKLPEYQRAKYDLSSMKLAWHGAAPIPVPVKEEMIRWWGPILFEAYGGTEGNGMTAITSQEWLQHKGSVGRAFQGVLHILDDDGNELPPGQPGTVYFSDGPVFEYHNDPEKTAASRNEKGWSTLRDVGYLDSQGYLYLTDRKDHMIITGGENIYPQEAENVLITHPKVLDAAVLGVPHEEFGEEVKGVVQPADMADAGPGLEQELIAFCRQHLAKIKCPVSIDFVEELPRTPTGKLVKRVLKERYWKDKGRMI